MFEASVGAQQEKTDEGLPLIRIDERSINVDLFLKYAFNFRAAPRRPSVQTLLL